MPRPERRLQSPRVDGCVAGDDGVAAGGTRTQLSPLAGEVIQSRDERVLFRVRRMPHAGQREIKPLHARPHARP